LVQIGSAAHVKYTLPNSTAPHVQVKY